MSKKIKLDVPKAVYKKLARASRNFFEKVDDLAMEGGWFVVAKDSKTVTFGKDLMSASEFYITTL